MKVTVENFIRIEGSIAIFEGVNEKDQSVRFACDHRYAQPIIDDLNYNDEFSPEVYIEGWQVL
jgi:hypothetical protein